MKEIGISLKLLLPDEVAEVVHNTSEEALTSDITYFLIQKANGGYVITSKQLDDIVDNILDIDEDDEDGDVSSNLSAERLEEVVSAALTKVLSNVTIPVGVVMNTETTNVVEEPKEDMASREILSFSTDDGSSGDVDDSALDDLADLFGF